MTKQCTYSEVLADTCQHYRLPEWPNARTIVSLGNGLRLYWNKQYVGFIGSINSEDQKRTDFEKVI